MEDFLFVVIAIAGGIGCGTMVIFICTFACRYRNGASKVNLSKSRNKSEVEPILGLTPDGNSVDADFIESNKGDVSPSYPSCRKASSVINPCECDGDPSTTSDKRPCQVQFSLFYNFHNSHLFINIMCALSVPRRWYGKYPPTQVRFQLLPDGCNIYRTEIKSNSGEPIFNETFEFIGYSENELRELILRLGLYAFDKFSRGKMIGYTDVYFNMEKFQPSEPTILWRDLLPKSQTRGCALSLTRGEIHVSLRYEFSRARLNIIVLKASNLLKTSKFLTTAPYVSVSLNADGVVLECRKTKKANGINPVWNQGFLFDVVNERIDDYSLTIKVINHDLLSNNELIGQLTIGPQCKGTGREHWEEAMTKKFNRREVSMTHILDPC